MKELCRLSDWLGYRKLYPSPNGGLYNLGFNNKEAFDKKNVMCVFCTSVIFLVNSSSIFHGSLKACDVFLFHGYRGGM